MKYGCLFLAVCSTAISASAANAHLCFVEKITRVPEGAQVFFSGDAVHAPISVIRSDGSDRWYIRYSSGEIGEVDSEAPPTKALTLGYGDQASILDAHSTCTLEVVKDKDRDGLKLLDEGAIYPPPGAASAVHRKEEFIAFP